MNHDTTLNKLTGAFLGLAVGDALGVPFEFRSREEMRANPATTMIGYGTWNQHPGTWSDDSSLAFCLAESLTRGYDLADIAARFVNWAQHGYWSARGKVFDIGGTTADAISRLEEILKSERTDQLRHLFGSEDEYENGNGALMRILPLLMVTRGKDLADQWALVKEVSALTHRHIRSSMACLIYLRVAERLWDEQEKLEAYQQAREEIIRFWVEIDFPITEQQHFQRVIQHSILDTPYDELRGSGYVIHSLECSIWAVLTYEIYAETVFGLINLGEDTDTSACIGGGLAGLMYGHRMIPDQWIRTLAREADITELAHRLAQKYP